MIVYKLKDGKVYDKEKMDAWIKRNALTITYEEVDIAVDADVKDAKFEDLVDGVFSRRLYDERKQRQYENRIESYIRERYSINQELAILRQRDSKPSEFDAYNTFVENCKTLAKRERELGLI